MSKRSPLPCLALSLLAYFALWLTIPKAHFLVTALGAIDSRMRHAHQPLSTILALCGILILAIPTVTFMAAQISVIYFFCKQKMALKGALLWLLGSVVGLAGTVAYILWRVDIVDKLHRLPNAREIGFIISVSRFGVAKMLMYAALLLIACSIGYLISLRIKDKNLLLPVVMFAASVDFWTVTIGPVSTMMTKMPEVVSAVSAPIPKAGTGGFVPAVTMGIGDPLFMALVFAAVHRLAMNGRRNFGFIFAIMTVAMLAVMMDALPYLPALVTLAIAVVAANWGQFKLSKQEKISTAIVAAVLLASLPVIWTIVGHPARTEHPKRVERRSRGAEHPEPVEERSAPPARTAPRPVSSPKQGK